MIEPMFDPGPGWRRMGREDTADGHDMLELHPAGNDDPDDNVLWVREEPVPPLPTIPYTVIRVTWKKPLPIKGAGETLFLNRVGNWQLECGVVSSAALRSAITSFEVLAEPRAKTAKAVLKRVRGMAMWEIPPDQVDGLLDNVAREFGGEP